MKDVAVVAYCRTGIARATRGALGVVVQRRDPPLRGGLVRFIPREADTMASR